MKSWIFIFLSLVMCGTRLSAQDSMKVVDRVYTLEGMIYEGHITTDVKGDYLVIEYQANKSIMLTYHDITKIQHDVRHPVPNESTDNEDADSSSVTYKKANDPNGLITFDGYKASSAVNEKMVKKRNTGIVLTVIGIGLLATGIALAATTPSQSVNNGYGSITVTPGTGALVGVAMIIAGAGITIPGAILWGKNGSKIRRAQRL